MAVVYGLVIASIIIILFLIFDDFVATVFTSDPPTVAIVKNTMPFIAFYLFFDSIHGVNSGNIRAIGRQGIASVITLVSLYAIGMPLALLMGFKKYMGVPGFWAGFCVALIGCDIAVALVLYTAKWVPVTSVVTDDTAGKDDDYELDKGKFDEMKKSLAPNGEDKPE